MKDGFITLNWEPLSAGRKPPCFPFLLEKRAEVGAPACLLSEPTRCGLFAFLDLTNFLDEKAASPPGRAILLSNVYPQGHKTPALRDGVILLQRPRASALLPEASTLGQHRQLIRAWYEAKGTRGIPARAGCLHI